MSPAPRIPRAVGFQRKRDPKPGMDMGHLANIRLLPCCVCGESGVHAHHLKRLTGEGPTGIGRRRDDRWAIPLCPRHHNGHRDSAHGNGNDEVWLAGKGVDGRALAYALWAARGDMEGMQRVMFRHRQGAAL